MRIVWLAVASLSRLVQETVGLSVSRQEGGIGGMLEEERVHAREQRYAFGTNAKTDHPGSVLASFALHVSAAHLSPSRENPPNGKHQHAGWAGCPGAVHAWRLPTWLL